MAGTTVPTSVRTRPRIDSLTIGDHITVRFGSASLTPEAREEVAVFLGITGEGNERHAQFAGNEGTEVVIWEAYRHADLWTKNTRWAYGPYAERVTLVRVNTPSPLR
jgi:hypothetical protein